LAVLSPPQRSNEVRTLAQRITGEILRARGQVVNESRLGDDLTEACAFARQTLKDGGGFARKSIQAARDTQSCPPPPTTSTHKPTSASIADVVSEMRQSACVCVIIIDAVNQLEGDPAHALDWLPSAEDCVNLPPDVVVVVSSTPGALLDELEGRARRRCST
jgi:hypothetical protein